VTDFVSRSADLAEPTMFPWIADGFAFGGDYNPEQWPAEVWARDVELMQQVGVNAVNLGVFSWGLLEVADGVWSWEWLDQVLDVLHAGGIGVNLATPTAAPPIWLLDAHPEIATVDDRGVRTGPGGRLAWSPSSATFRHYALRMVRELAQRYGNHPALRLWHVSNELGNENARCYSAETGAAWQEWLRARYGDIATVNATWGTAFWGHHYTAFEQVQPPRHCRTGHNPGLLLDFERFTSDALLGHYLAERAVLREITPHLPVTTNFMVMNNPGIADYARWGAEVDLVSNDHYTIGADPLRHTELSFSADRTRGVARGRPWLLIEHSTGAVNWQPVNRAKAPGELLRNSLAHIARGADGAMFFQWRMSTAGAEQHHSGIVSHAGATTRIFREVEQLGAILRAIRPVLGTVVEPARVAVLFDHDSAAALRSGRKPSTLLTAPDLPVALHRAFTTRGIAVDVVPTDTDLDCYDLVVVPTLYLATDATATALEEFARRGGHVLVSYFSGIVDETNRVRTGGYPGAFRELLGVQVEEFFPLLESETVTLDTGATASLWTELLELSGAKPLAHLASGVLAGTPALTRHHVGAGTATYLATRLDDAGLLALVDELVALARVAPVALTQPGLEVVRRIGDAGSFLFAINHTTGPLDAHASGTDLVTGAVHTGVVTVPAGGVVVIDEAR
jgi:beta-galactosidase